MTDLRGPPQLTGEGRRVGSPLIGDGAIPLIGDGATWRWSLSARQLIDLPAKISETRLAQRGSAGFALAQVRSG
jgi:hypothetical protein